MSASKFTGTKALETARVLLARAQTWGALGLPSTALPYFDDLVGALGATDSKADVVSKAKRLRQAQTAEERLQRWDGAAAFLTAVLKENFLAMREVATASEARKQVEYLAGLDNRIKLGKIPWDALPSNVSVAVLSEYARK